VVGEVQRLALERERVPELVDELLPVRSVGVRTRVQLLLDLLVSRVRSIQALADLRGGRLGDPARLVCLLQRLEGMLESDSP